MATGSVWRYRCPMSETAASQREYQRALVAAIDAELGVRRWSRARLAELSGIKSQTMDRVFLLRRDMNVAQLAAIASALELEPDELVMRAKEWRTRLPAPLDQMISNADVLTETQKEQARNEFRTKRDNPGSAPGVIAKKANGI